MAQLHGDKDEQFATGAIVGGTANLIGPVVASKVAAISATKLGAVGALQIGIKLTVFSNPIFAGIAVAGGLGYLAYKALS